MLYFKCVTSNMPTNELLLDGWSHHRGRCSFSKCTSICHHEEFLMVSHLHGLIGPRLSPFFHEILPLIHEESLFKYDSHCIQCLSDYEIETVLKKIEEAKVGGGSMSPSTRSLFHYV